MTNFNTSWWIDDQKKKILECLNKTGFKDVFDKAVTFAAPVRWSGYKIGEFFIQGAKHGSDVFDFLRALLNDVCRNLMFPQEPALCAAIYFWLWRIHGKGIHPCAGLGALADGSGDSQCSNSEPGHQAWSLFYLLYLDSKSWSIPHVFKGEDSYLDPDDEPRLSYVYQEVCRQLCGVRTSSARTFTGRSGSEEQFKRICAKSQRSFWDAQFARIEKTPDIILALSFYANGYASFKTKSNQSSNTNENSDFLFDLLNRSTHYYVYVPEDDWDARAVFFLLAQWLFLYDRRKEDNTLEERIFAILYLRFYRQGVDGYLGRPSMRKLWDAITFEEKERVAAKYRKLLISTRNKAAERWPSSTASDYPEIYCNYWGKTAFDELFFDLARDGKVEAIKSLIKAGMPNIDQYANAILWTASHSKSTCEYLQTLAQHFTSPVHFKDLTKDQVEWIRDGWSILPSEDMEWSRQMLDALCGKGVVDKLLKSLSSLISSAIQHNESTERIKSYIEDLGLCPNGPESGDDALWSHPPLYHAVAKGNQSVVELLIDNGAEVNCGGARNTCLGSAISLGHMFIAKVLIFAGANPNFKSGNGCLPLYWAIIQNNEDGIRLLIEAGANPSLVAGEFSESEHQTHIWSFVLSIYEKHKNGVNVAVDVGNLIPKNLMSAHYDKQGNWKIDEPDPDEFDSIEDYADAHPEYTFKPTNNGEILCVGIHDPQFGQSLGASLYSNMTHGGCVVAIEDEDE